jgi:hypothetical protein
MPALSWDELDRDLRLASHWSNDIYIHSLEGCVGQGFLSRLRTFDWVPTTAAPQGSWVASGSRRLLRGVLWTDAHPWRAIGIVAASAWLLRRWRNARNS